MSSRQRPRNGFRGGTIPITHGSSGVGKALDTAVAARLRETSLELTGARFM